MKSLPDSVVFYKSTPEFNESSVPLALKRDHTTATGVWAKINVIEGALTYYISGEAPERHELTAGVEGIIEPQVKHFVDVSVPVRFRVDFYR
jgi:tellurite methyltransferase